MNVPTRSAHLCAFALILAGCDGVLPHPLGAPRVSSAGDDNPATSGENGGNSDLGGPASGSTANVLCNVHQAVFNDDESVGATSNATWSCADTTRSLVANGLPDHEVGTFPNRNNPNTITAQDVAFNFPLSPEISSPTGDPTQVVAYALNGVKFEVGTAGTCNDAGDCAPIGNGGTWRMEAVGDSSFDFGNDESNGHVQPFGAYHYHGIPEGLLAKLGKGATPTLVGWAVDGFPIYARYGYSIADDASSAVTVLTSSYELKATGDAGRPSTSIYPMGAFTQDWSYAEGSGDLDECNGRVGVTPEFPDGIYHYYLTDSFPFGQRCVKGSTIDGGGGPGAGGPAGPGAGGPGAGGPAGPGGGQPLDCAQAEPGWRCCGDGICDGPETATNCPADCD